MNNIKAAEYLFKGKKITNMEWDIKKEFVHLNNGCIIDEVGDNIGFIVFDNLKIDWLLFEK